MAFCSKCGAEITTEGKFCPKCGAPISGAEGIVASNGNNVEQDKNSTKNVRNESLVEIQNVYDYFSKKVDSYNQFDMLNNKIASFPKTKKTILGAAIIILVGIYIIIVNNSEVIPDLVCKILEYGLSVLSLVGYILIRIKLKKTNKANIELRDALNREITDYYNAYVNCPIGIEFSRPQDISMIMNTIRSGRADTISAAINIILDDEHKANMERKAGEIAQASKEAARAAKAAATNSFINLFK